MLSPGSLNYADYYLFNYFNLSKPKKSPQKNRKEFPLPGFEPGFNNHHQELPMCYSGLLVIFIVIFYFIECSLAS